MRSLPDDAAQVGRPLMGLLRYAFGAAAQFAVVVVSLLAAVSAGAQDPDARRVSDRPNIVLIVADDLGYSDLGIFGSEIATPNIDRLAAGGVVLTEFHAGMTCSPTRAMLMSGTDHHQAGLGVMGTPTRPEQLGRPGYEGYLNFHVVSMAELLRDGGYHTYMTGKWHLGAEAETGPAARGFERSFVSIDGGSHLGGLSWGGPGLAPYRDGEELVDVGEDFYSTRFYTERMIEYIEADRGDEQPFFAYLAYTAPHWPLQAPRESIERFHGRYDDGYDALYQRRLARMRSLDLVAANFAGIPPIEGQPAWAELGAEQQRIEARKMEIYAAMISDLDTFIGRFVDYLATIGELDDTLILFMSDNGPEASRRDLAPPIRDWVATCCNNAYENLGNGDSYVMYGPNWARASAVPFRRSKATAFEGGTHVPAFVRYPGVIDAGARSPLFATVVDVLPTFLEVAGLSHPDTYHGHAVLPLAGRSFLSSLRHADQPGARGDILFGWELYRHRAIRSNDWKIVWDPSESDARWHLFNIAADPGEQTDLADRNPAKLAELVGLWDSYRSVNGVVLAE
jgi:arylsulfatase